MEHLHAYLKGVVLASSRSGRFVGALFCGDKRFWPRAKLVREEQHTKFRGRLNEVWLKMRYTCSVLSTNAAKSYNNRLEVLKILDDLCLTPPFNANYVGHMH